MKWYDSMYDSMYERLENSFTPALENLTVAYLEICERSGEPWPISGDATTIMRGENK